MSAPNYSVHPFASWETPDVPSERGYIRRVRATDRTGFLPIGGEGGIRTHVGFQAQLVFETSTFNRSVTSPCPGSLRRAAKRRLARPPSRADGDSGATRTPDLFLRRE